ncbi:MAG: MFS transporter [Alicyclobacillus sp.]|nr:MFS transporter [Alicyclobacillus sp.]
MTKRTEPWLVLSATSLGVLLATLNLSTLNVALPEVSTYFHADAVASSWILLSYMLVNTILILVFGKLADILGRRRLYLIGLTEFTAVSLLCGFAPNVWTLVLLRALQAVGGALIITNTTPLITDAFSEGHLGTALSINIFVASAAQLLGPLAGGYLVYTLGWRWVFWFNVPIGLVDMVWAAWVIRLKKGMAQGERIDWWGNVSAFLGLGGLILALSEGGVTGWGSPMVIAGLVLFVVFAGIFIWVERKVEFPMIDFSLFRDRPYAMANLSTFLNALARSSIVLLIALYYQVVHDDNPFTAGLRVLPVTVGMMMGAPLVAPFTEKYSARLLSTAGLGSTCLGMLTLWWQLGRGDSGVWITLGQLLVGVGTGVFQTPNTQSIMLTVPVDRRGVANGIRSMLQNMGAVISTGVSLMLVTSALPPRLKAVIYAGASARLTQVDIGWIAHGYHMVLVLLLVLTLFAIAASYFR